VSASDFAAPDGQVIDRKFEVAIMPPSRIVLCTDDSAYSARLQIFMDYVLGDMPLELVAWQEAPTSDQMQNTHLVYVGHPPENTAAYECLSKYPVLRGFVELVRDFAPREFEPPVPIATRDKLEIVSQGFTAPRNLLRGDNVLSAYFCYPTEATCAFDISTSLFGLNGSALCSNVEACEHLKGAMEKN
jgi:hypothetical protein